MKKLFLGAPAFSLQLQKDAGFRERWVCATGNALLADVRHNIRCVAFSEGELRVAVRSRAWQEQVNSQAADVIRKLNSLAKSEVVQRLVPVVECQPFRDDLEKQRPGSMKDSNPGTAVIDAASHIKDEAVRKAFIKLASKWERLRRASE